MATEFTWTINGLMVENQGSLTNVAVMSNFQISGTDGEYTGDTAFASNGFTLTSDINANGTTFIDLKQVLATTKKINAITSIPQADVNISGMTVV